MLCLASAHSLLEGVVALTAEQIEELRKIDAPTVSNAIEQFEKRPLTAGYTGTTICNLAPELGVMVGYAVTALLDTMTERAHADSQATLAMWEAIEESPKPVVLVLKDMSSDPTHSVHAGDGMATLAHVLGAEGIVTDGALRDLTGISELGVKTFARGLAASHGNHRILRAQVPVCIDGMDVCPGDLVHGDENGLVTIPLEIADRVAAASREIWEMEERIRQSYLHPDFSLDEYAKSAGLERRSPTRGF
jgi:regulator of RNase E activity RraA